MLGLLSLSCHTDARAAQETPAKHPVNVSIQIDPTSMREYAASLDGFERTWKAYVPKRCEGIPAAWIRRPE